MAKNRYGWNKRLKEIARKMKQEDKLKRRQSKSQKKSEEESPEDAGDKVSSGVEDLPPG